MSLASDLATEPVTKWTWGKLSKQYERSLLIAEPTVLQAAERLGVKATLDELLRATACIFIEACQGGVAEPKVKLPPKEPTDGL